MSRRWTGWVLTAAAIAAGPAPALSSNQSPQPLLAILAQAAPADGYTPCLEVATPPEPLVLRNGEVLVLDRPYPPSEAKSDLRFEGGMAGDVDDRLGAAIDHSKRAASGQAMLPWPSLPAGKRAPEGTVQPTEARAACGIPKGLTLLAPAAASSTASAIMMSWTARAVRPATVS